MNIRFLTGDDAEEYWGLRLEALEGDPEAFSSSPEEHRALSMEEVKRRLGAGNSDSAVVGAFVDGRLVGTTGFYRENGPKVRHKARVWGVYVTPAQRGSGLGRKMMEKVLERAAATEGVEQVLLSVASTQVAAGKLYRSLGFESFGTEPRALKIGERFIDEEYLILYLKNSARLEKPQF